MATKKINKRLLKIISATSMAVFSLLVSITGAYAWFVGVRDSDNRGDDFVVTGNASINAVYIVPFLGETSGEATAAYTFDVNNMVTAFDGDYNNSANSVMLNQYSLENPNHPILMLFKVDGTAATIRFTTDYCFLGNNRDEFIYGKTATKSDLNSLSKTAGKYYEVVADETMSDQTSLYYFTGSQLENRTVSSYTALENLSLSAGNDGDYYRVLSDNNHNNVSSIYQYNASAREFEMVWINLGNSVSHQNNPLSSAVNFHYFTFDQEIAGLTTQHTVNVETYNPVNEAFSYSIQNNQSCIAIPKNQLTDSNKSSFTNFKQNDDYRYRNEVVPFSGDVDGQIYVGVLVNYDSLAIEYICSNNLGHEALNAGLSFICDWKTEF